MLVEYVRWLDFRGLADNTVKRRMTLLSRYLTDHPDPWSVTTAQVEDLSLIHI